MHSDCKWTFSPWSQARATQQNKIKQNRKIYIMRIYCGCQLSSTSYFTVQNCSHLFALLYRLYSVSHTDGTTPAQGCPYFSLATPGMPAEVTEPDSQLHGTRLEKSPPHPVQVTPYVGLID